MKSLILLLLLALPLSSETSRLSTMERITSYHSDIVINEDTSLTVTETINVVANGNSIKRGIFRDFPQIYKTEHGFIRKRDLEINRVTRNGKTEPYQTTRLENGTRIRIGNPDRILQPGPHTYSITYTTKRQLGYFPDHDELYWNVTGNGWAFPIEQASATIHLPPNADLLERDAWTGSTHSTTTEAKFVINPDGSTTVTTTSALHPNEGLTFKIQFDKGHLNYARDRPNILLFFRDNPIILGLGFALVFVTALLLYGWIKHGRDPKSGTIIPQYDAPEGLSAAAIRRIHSTEFDDTTLTTAVLGLAAKGALRIREKSWGHRLIETEPKPGTTLTEDEKLVRSTLFSEKSELDLIPHNSAILSSARNRLATFLKHLTEPEYHAHNSRFSVLATGAFASLFLVSSIMSHGHDPLSPLIQMIAAIPVFFTVRKTLLRPPRRVISRFFHALLALFFLALWGTLTVILAQQTSPTIAALAVTCELMIMIFTQLNKAYTKHGRKILDEIKGLQRYLSVAEKDRLNLENPPKRTPEHFEKFLPYALALDVEQQWAEQFDDLFDSPAESSPRYSPSFYDGSPSFSSSLGAAGLTSVITTTLGANISAASVNPSTSGSSSGSSGGFSGGGFSGGGGGGGGGGGW